jgi:ethanolamine transporter
MESIVTLIVGVFFVIGLIDYGFNNKLGLGNFLEDGVKAMGSLAISMVGILSLTPFISKFANNYIVPYFSDKAIDTSIITSSILAVDMGAFKIAEEIGRNKEMIFFSGILISSIIGCTISFTIPLALGIINKKDINIFCKGILCGVITTPIGLFIGGLLLKIELKTILINLLPIIIISIIIGISLLKFQSKVIKTFNYIANSIIVIGLIGFSIQGFTSITGIVVLKDLLPLKEALNIVGRIALFLGGANVLLEIIKKILKKWFNKIGGLLKINEDSIGALIGSLASAVIVFNNFHKLDNRGKVITAAFSVAGAYVLGGQLAYVAVEGKEVVPIYIITKLISGIAAIALALYITRNDD